MKLKQMIRGVIFAIGLASVGILTLLVSSPVSAVPQLPHVFYGTVTVNGAAAENGLVIQARIGGVNFGKSVNASPITQNGTYGTEGLSNDFQVTADDPDTRGIVEGGTNGQTIEFYISGVRVSTFSGGSAVSLTFKSGGVGYNGQPVNLVATITETTTTTTTTISGAAGGGISSAQLEGGSSAGAAALVAGLDTGDAATALLGVTTQRAADILGLLELSKAKAIVEQLTAVQATNILEILGSARGAAIFEELALATVVSIFEGLTTDKAAAIFGLLSDAKAASIIDGGSTEKAALVLAGISSDKGASILEGVKNDKVASIIAAMANSKAVEIIELINIIKAISVIEVTTTKVAIELVEELSAVRSGEILEGLSIAKSAEIMEGVTTAKLILALQTMSAVALLAKMPEISRTKLYTIAADTIFALMPDVPADQLVKQMLPTRAAGVPAPTLASATTKEFNYIVKTVLADWADLVATPLPLVSVKAKFKNPYSGVGLKATLLDSKPSNIAAELPADKGVFAYFQFDLENAKPEDILSAIVSYEVNQAFLSDAGFHKWSVLLHRYDVKNEQWVDLPTSLLEEDSSAILYASTTQKFSVFAISASIGMPTIKFRISDLSVPTIDIGRGQSATIEATVSNLTAKRSAYMTTLWINDVAELTQQIVLEPNGTGLVSFPLIKSPGVYNVRIGRQLGKFTVSEQAVPEVKPTAIPTIPTPTPQVVVAKPTPAPARTPTPEPTALTPTPSPAVTPGAVTPTPGPTPLPVTPVPTTPVSRMELSNFMINPSQVGPGDPVVVSIMVSNTGESSVVRRIAVLIDGKLEQSQEVHLGAGEKKTVKFTVMRVESGKYIVVIGQFTGTFEVSEPFNWLFIGIPVLVIIIIVGGFIGRAYIRKQTNGLVTGQGSKEAGD